MWIAVVVPAAALIGVLAWWLRRNPAGGAAGDRFEAVPAGEWASPLAADARAAFMEGLRACHESGGALRVDEERGVLTAYEPPRMISLHLLADAFAARGDAAMHDPQGTVAAALEQLTAVERPGVLHLRAGWPEGEVDGMDAARFADAVAAVAGGSSWSGTAELGALQVVVPGARAEGLSHVNGTPLKTVSRDGGPPDEDGGSRVADCGSWAEGGGSRAGAANTLMLDLARVLEAYREEREKRAGAAAEELLREVLARLAAAGGPGLTWVRPPTQEELRAVMGGSPELR